jgi:hypothetical protein
MVKVLGYELEGSELETQWNEWIFSIYLIIPAAVILGFNQPLTEMSTTAICEQIV